MTGAQNLRLLQEIEANRAFILDAYRQNPGLLAKAELRILQLLQPLPTPSKTPQPLPTPPNVA